MWARGSAEPVAKPADWVPAEETEERLRRCL